MPIKLKTQRHCQWLGLSIFMGAAFLCQVLALLAFPTDFWVYCAIPKYQWRIVRSCLASLPVAGMLGWICGYVAYRQAFGLLSSVRAKVILSRVPIVWVFPIFLVMFSKSYFAIAAVAFLWPYFRYTADRGEGLQTGRVRYWAPPVALLFFIIAFTIFIRPTGKGTWGDAMAYSAYGSLWLGDTLTVHFISDSRRQGWLNPPESGHFQFSISSLVLVVLGIGAYATILRLLFPLRS